MLPLIQLFAAVIFYIVSGLFIFGEPLINKFGSIQWDAVSVHFFNLFFSSETWSKEVFPLWTPYIFAGFPQIADLQVAFFYPINLIISAFAVFTPEIMMHQIILHYFLAGFFAFILARYLSGNFWFGAGAGLVYSFGGFMAGHASHVGMQNTASWLPLIFLFLIIALKKEKAFFASLCGLFLGIAILAGHFQISLYIAYAIAFYFIFDIIWTIAAGAKKENGGKLFHMILRKFRLVALIYIIAFFISAIQLLPTYELARESNRAEISLEMSQTESLNPESLKSLIDPNYNNVSYGTPYRGPWDRTQNYLYLGSSIIILAILGIIFGIFYRDTRQMTIFWLALLILSMLYSFGGFGFLQKYFYHFVPLFDKIRAPANMMLLFNIAVIGLASSLFKNIDEIFQKFKNPPITDNSRSMHNIFKKIFFKNIPSFLGISAFLIISLEIFPAVLPNTLLYSRQKPSEVVAAPLIAERIIEEYGRLAEIDKFRIFKVSPLDYNLTQVLHIFAFDGYNPLSFKRHANYTDAMVKNANLIDLAGIKYLPCEYIASRANNLEKTGTLCVNKTYFKLAFYADDYIVASNEADALQKTQEVDLKKTIVLEEIPRQSINNENYPKNGLSEKTKELSMVEFHPGSWRLKAETGKDAFLLINQANYPGWVAKIDGVPAKIYQADYLFQAIFIPKGKHEITIAYKPKPLIIGALLAIIGLSSVFLIALYDLRPKRKV